MRLFHVSEESNIEIFIPRIPKRADIDKSKGLVWALTEQCLPNFLTPRDCPRVTYHAAEETTREDIDRFFSSSSRHCVAIEHGWHKRMTETTLYIYEFDTADFRLIDKSAGYYVSEKPATPISITKYDDLYGELFKRDVEVRLLSNLWEFSEAIKKTTFNWSMCRMANALPKA